MMNSHFIWPLSGGLLIGLSAGLYLLLTGRIAGISGLTASALGWTSGGVSILGLGFIGGLLVGFGTRLGSGCTSGHGVCGLARLSPRSMVATMTFMIVAAITVYVTRHLVGGF